MTHLYRYVPAHVVDVRVLVEVVAVLADVVQLGVEGGVVFTPTRAAVSLTGHEKNGFILCTRCLKIRLS